ncbi:MAG: adenylate/guanylate cyclase domain-containing protein [Acidimicrobiales bacterium]
MIAFARKAVIPRLEEDNRSEGTARAVAGRFGGHTVTVTAMPHTRYIKAGDVHVAYQVVGTGPLDLVFVPGAASHLECLWEEPGVARFYRRLASFSRLIMFDKRGTGMSDRVQGVPTLEERMDDVRAVMDAVGSTQAALCGMSEGGAIAALFAATFPRRVSALVTIGSGATGWQPGPVAQDEIDRYIEEHWGSGLSVSMMAPSVAKDDRIRAWFGKWERLSASPGAAVELLRMNAQFDINSVLPAISVPTLVIHRTGDLTYDIRQGRALADQVSGARFAELPGTDHAPWFEDPEEILELIEEFVTGARRGAEPERVLATTVFTDIVDSTRQASRLGDRRWKETLDQYDSIVQRELDRLRGRLVKTTGDGTLATFDGPARGIRFACAVRDVAARSLDLELRAGVHTGEVELRGDDISGLAVVIGQRISALAAGGEVLVSSTVKDLVVGSGIEFAEHGAHDLKGVPGRWTVFAVQS